MACDQTAWSSAAADYEAAMSNVLQTCEAYEASILAREDAERALTAAQDDEAAKLAAKEAALQVASQKQTAVGLEAEKLGVECQCPQPPAPATFRRS